MKKFTPLALMAMVLVLTGARCSNPFSNQQQPPTQEKTELQKNLEEIGIYENETAPVGEGIGQQEQRQFVDLSGELTTTPQETKTVVVNLEMKSFEFFPSEIVVNQGDTLIINATSIDQPHGYTIEGYNISARPAVGEVVTQEFVADKVGRFTIRCIVYCGDGHQEMTATLIVQ
ncbi:hypothetical protein IT409_00385 [Candidatus Falkowbacteria bacterium]|nr:hypothetical protein [Candidatus Falkowbacteria bacterium]